MFFYFTLIALMAVIAAVPMVIVVAIVLGNAHKRQAEEFRYILAILLEDRNDCEDERRDLLLAMFPRLGYPLGRTPIPPNSQAENTALPQGKAPLASGINFTGSRRVGWRQQVKNFQRAHNAKQQARDNLTAEPEKQTNA